MKPIRGVLFDLGGVVLDSPFAAIAALESELGCQPDTINRIIGSSGSDGAFSRLERGEITVDDFAHRSRRIARAWVRRVTSTVVYSSTGSAKRALRAR